MKHFYFLCSILLLSIGLSAQNYTSDELNEIQQAQQSYTMGSLFQGPIFGGIDYGDEDIHEDFIPTAGATQTFTPAVGDFFFDTGGPGGGGLNPGGGNGTELDGNYLNCGCVTTTTLSGVTQIEFSVFEIFGNFDWLKIYDGTNTSGTLLYDSNTNSNTDTLAGMIAYNGSGVFTGTSGSITFEFNATTVVDHTGWEVEILEGDGGGNSGPCSHENPSNGFENGTPNSLYGTANDLIVPADETFTLEQVVANIIVPTGSTITFADLYYYDNNGSNLPGTQLGSQMNVTPTSQTIIGTAFGMDVREVILDVTPFDFNAGASDTTFWIRLHTPNTNGTASFWEATSATTVGNFAAGYDLSTSTWSYVPGWAGLDGVYQFNGTCSDDGNPDPDEGCEWTVTVSDDTNCGDEVSWTLTDGSGTVVLSGGPYTCDPYNDIQSITAEGPMTFYIESLGSWADNTPSFEVSNGTEVVLSGQLVGGTEQTVSDLNCDDGGDPPTGDCSQEFDGTPDTGVGFSDGYVSANDIVVAGNSTFTLQTITLEVAALSGEPTEFDLEIFNDNGTGGVGASTGETVHFDSSNMTYVPNGLLFGVYPQFTVTLTVPDIELSADTSDDQRYWLAVASSLSTTSDWTYWVSYAYSANPDSYPTWQNDGVNWFEYGGGDQKESIMTVEGICDDGGDPPTGDCSQEFDGTPDTGVGFSDGYVSANDIVVAGNSTFTLQTITLEVAALSGEPTEFDLEIFNDNGTGGVGASTGETVHFDSSNMTYVPNGLLFGVYPQFTVTLTVPDIELSADTSDDQRYWLAVASSLSTTNDWTYWVSYAYSANPDSYPTWQNDGVNWFEYGGGDQKESIMTVEGICDDGSEPGDGCEWTVSVFGNGFGDEVSWEFRDADGNVVLSGGPYTDIPFSDTQTITAQDPVEFYIETIGTWNDNTPSFTIENENGVILSGTAAGGTEETYSDIMCSDTPPPPPSECEDHEVLDNGMENAYFLTNRLAVDIPVGDAGFTVEGLFITIAVPIGTNASSFNFIFYDNNSGVPGTEVDSALGTIIGSDIIGQNFGRDFIQYNVDFDAGVALTANTTYWMEVQSDAEAWDWSSDSMGIIGYPGVIDNGGGWAEADGGEFVYALYCDEMGASDMNSFNFAYYPNPVKDFLNIQSQKAVKSIEAFNLAGQKVINGAQLLGGKLNLSNLAPGTYVFRVTLEDGQVETFKIVKK